LQDINNISPYKDGQYARQNYSQRQQTKMIVQSITQRRFSSIAGAAAMMIA